MLPPLHRKVSLEVLGLDGAGHTVTFPVRLGSGMTDLSLKGFRRILLLTARKMNSSFFWYGKYYGYPFKRLLYRFRCEVLRKRLSL